jgi:hypothetical protein
MTQPTLKLSWSPKNIVVLLNFVNLAASIATLGYAMAGPGW